MWDFLAYSSPLWLVLAVCWWLTRRPRPLPEPRRRQLPGEQHVQQVVVANDHADAQRIVALLKAHDIPALPRVEEGAMQFSSRHTPVARTLNWSVVVPNADAERAMAALAAAAALEPQGPASPADIRRALDDDEDDDAAASDAKDGTGVRQ